MFTQSQVQVSNSSCPCPTFHSQRPFATSRRKLNRKLLSQKDVKNIFVHTRKDICTPQISTQKTKRQCVPVHQDPIAVPAPIQRSHHPKFCGPQQPLKYQTLNDHTGAHSNETRTFEIDAPPSLSPSLSDKEPSLTSPTPSPLPVCTFITKGPSKQPSSHNQRRCKRKHGVSPLDLTGSATTSPLEFGNPPQLDSFGVVTPTCSATSSPSITTTMENGLMADQITIALNNTIGSTTPNFCASTNPIDGCVSATVNIDLLSGEAGFDDCPTTFQAHDPLDWAQLPCTFDGTDFSEFGIDCLSHDTHDTTTASLNACLNGPGPENWTPCPVCDSAAASHTAHTNANANATPSLDGATLGCEGGGGDDDDVTISTPASINATLSSVKVADQVTQLNQPTAHCGFPLMDDDSKEVACHVVKVERGTTEFNDVAASMECCNFEDTGLEVLKVFRVQNPTLYNQFLAKRISDELKPWAATTDINPRQVFHVTRAKHLEALLVEGLDQRLASRGRFGRGLYFAEDPRKSNQYWKGKGDIKMMLRASVLTGRTKKYQANSIDPSLLREPKGYDSVQGELYGQREFVVYDSARVQIEHIITYQQRGHANTTPV